MYSRLTKLSKNKSPKEAQQGHYSRFRVTKRAFPISNALVYATLKDDGV